MLRSSRKGFRLSYYISSLLPVYFLLIIFMFTINIERNDNIFYVFDIIDDHSHYNFVFCTFIVFFILSLICLLFVKRAIKSTLAYKKTLGTKKVSISNKFNSGFREFIFSVILPLMSTFSINDFPVATLVMVIVFQFIIYVFFENSSDLFPNISLVLLKYSFFYVSDNYGKSNLQYVLGKTSDIDKLISGKKEIEVVKMGESNFPDNVGVLVKFEESKSDEKYGNN